MKEERKENLHDNVKKGLLELIKEAKAKNGAVIGENVVNEMLIELKGFSDDDLLLKMTEFFGHAASLIAESGDVFKVYCLLLVYYYMEREAQERALYW
jgi:hypothetical protein